MALAVVQARMSSTRLPGKSLADVCGEPMLALLLRRLGHAERVSDTVVATSEGAEDDVIADLAAQLGVRFVRGPRDDVLHRFVMAIEGHHGAVVRVTGDCPLVDPAVVDAAVELFDSTPGCRYAHNIEPRTYPDGLDVEVTDADALRELDSGDAAADEREHVTLGLRRQPERFPAALVPGPPELAALHWTVDTDEDLEFVRAVVAELGDARYSAGWEEILAAAERVAPGAEGRVRPSPR